MNIRTAISASGFAVVVTVAELALVTVLGRPPSSPPTERVRRRAVVVDHPPAPPVSPDFRWQSADSAPDKAVDLLPAPVAPASSTYDFLAGPKRSELAAAMPSLSASAGWATEPRSGTEPNTEAVPRHRPPARYPREARRRGIEGYVVLRLRVDARGRVEDAVVIEAEPDDVFELSAKRAVLAYRFDPARSGGSPVASTLEQRLWFRLR